MALTNFVDKVTSVGASWLNSIDILWSTVFGEAATKAAARAALTSDAPMSVAQGGTGAITAGAARTALGSTATGDALFTAASAAAARSALAVAGLADNNVFTGANVYSRILAKSATYPVTTSDYDSLIIFSGLAAGATATLPDGATAGAAVWIEDKGDTAFAVTISRQTTAVLNVDAVNAGVNTYVLSRGERVYCEFDGTNWTLVSNQSRVVGNPTGGDKGVGTGNAANGYFDNGNRVWSATTPPSAAITQAMMANSAIGQAQLKATNGSVSVSAGTDADLTLPGGSYGFYPEIWRGSGGTTAYLFGTSAGAAAAAANSTVTPKAQIHLGSSGADTAIARQYYIQASPPYDEGDGLILLFIYLLMNPDGSIDATYVAPEAPYHYNGPTDIKADRYSEDGCSFKTVRQLIAEHGSIKNAQKSGLSLPTIMDRLMTDPFVEIEITQSMKMADRELIPHPFSVKPSQTVVLIDPVSPLTKKLAAFHHHGESVASLFHDGYLILDNNPIPRSAGIGVVPINAAWKQTR